jgi:hypothetical protein
MTDEIPMVERTIRAYPDGRVEIEGSRAGLRKLAEAILAVANDPRDVRWTITGLNGCVTVIQLFGATEEGRAEEAPPGDWGVEKGEER